MVVAKINLGAADLQRLGPHILPVGVQGENGAREVEWDYSVWAEQYGTGDFELVVLRPGGSTPYTLSLPSSNNVAVWSISSTDTAFQGNGKIQPQYSVGDMTVKSVAFDFKIREGSVHGLISSAGR